MAEEIKDLEQDQGTEPDADPSEDVSVEAMSDEELVKMIEGTPEEAPPPPAPDPPAPEPDGVVTPPETAPEPEGETPPPPPKEEAPAPKEPIDALKAEIDALKERVEHKESFIQRQGREIGELRKQLRDRAEHLKSEAESAESQYDAHQRFAEAQQVERQIRQLDVQERVETTRAQVHSMVPNFDELIPAIAEVALSDGIPPQVVEAFKQNPYAETPQLLVNLGRRAEMARKMKGLEEKITTLTSARDEAARRIAEAAKSEPVMSGGSGGATKDDANPLAGLSEENISDLSDEQLARLLKQHGKF